MSTADDSMLKFLAAIVTAVVALILGVWNLFATRSAAKTERFVNTVTSQRVLWIEQLRQDLAQFVGLAGTMTYQTEDGTPNQRENRIELTRLRHVVALRLNPKAEVDHEILELLPKIFKSSYNHDKSAAAEGQIETLTALGQLLLKDEWEKVKTEVKTGKIELSNESRI